MKKTWGSSPWVSCLIAAAAVTVYLGFDLTPADENERMLTVNGRACAPLGRAEDLSRFGDAQSGSYCRQDCAIYRYELADASDLPNLLTLTFANGGKTLRVTYCEIDVDP